MWYYKFFRTITNIHRIIIYLVLTYFQKNLNVTYNKVKVISSEDENIVKRYYFLNDLESCGCVKISRCDCLILIDNFTLFTFIKFIRCIKRIRVIDINFFAHLGLNMLINIGFFDIATKYQRSSMKNSSLKNYYTLKELLQDTEVFVLGTNATFTKNLKLLNNRPLFICNDAIYKISEIKAEIIVFCFADPLFHFSADKNSINFLNTIKQNEKYIDYLVVPINTIPIIKNMQINTKIIGVNSSNKNQRFLEINKSDLTTKKTHNIMTQFMLPISLSVSKKVFLGSVTVSNNFDKKLWNYDTTLMKNNQKNYAFKYSFFRDRNFKNYYKVHHRFLNKQINESNNLELL